MLAAFYAYPKKHEIRVLYPDRHQNHPPCWDTVYSDPQEFFRLEKLGTFHAVEIHDTDAVLGWQRPGKELECFTIPLGYALTIISAKKYELYPLDCWGMLDGKPQWHLVLAMAPTAFDRILEALMPLQVGTEKELFHESNREIVRRLVKRMGYLLEAARNLESLPMEQEEEWQELRAKATPFLKIVWDCRFVAKER